MDTLKKTSNKIHTLSMLGDTMELSLIKIEKAMHLIGQIPNPGTEEQKKLRAKYLRALKDCTIRFRTAFKVACDKMKNLSPEEKTDWENYLREYKEFDALPEFTPELAEHLKLRVARILALP